MGSTLHLPWIWGGCDKSEILLTQLFIILFLTYQLIFLWVKNTSVMHEQTHGTDWKFSWYQCLPNFQWSSQDLYEALSVQPSVGSKAHGYWDVWLCHNQHVKEYIDMLSCQSKLWQWYPCPKETEDTSKGRFHHRNLRLLHMFLLLQNSKPPNLDYGF